MASGHESDIPVEALNLLDRLKNNVKFITQEEEVKRAKESKEKKKTGSLLSKDRLKRFFLGNSMTFQHFERLQVMNKFEILPVDFEELLSKIPKIMKYDEFLLKRVVIDWKPYISANMKGVTTVLMGDFRSTDQRNVLKGGYTFPTSQSFTGGSIYPGYVVSTKDPNLNRIFRFYILTAGLDLIEDSYCGRLTLRFECQIGDSSFNIPLEGNELLIVRSAGSMTLAQTEPGPSVELLQDISSEEIIQTIQSFDSLKVRKEKEKKEKEEDKKRKGIMLFQKKEKNKEKQLIPAKAAEEKSFVLTDFGNINKILNLPNVDVNRRNSCSSMSGYHDFILPKELFEKSEIKEESSESVAGSTSEVEGPSFLKKSSSCGCSRLIEG